MEIIMLIKESAIEIVTAIGTIVTLILTRGKNPEQLKAKKERKLERMKAKNAKTLEKLKQNAQLIEDYEKETK